MGEAILDLDTGGEGGEGDTGDQTGRETSFRDMIPEDFRDHPTLKPYDSLDKLVKSHVEQARLLGADKDRLVKLPGEKATPEEVQAFYNRLGRPEKPEEYGLQVPKDVPEGVNFVEGGNQKLAEIFHKHGLSKGQAEAVFNDYVNYTLELYKDQAEQYSQGLEKARGALAEEWGRDYDAKVDMAKRAIKEFADEDTVNFLKENNLNNHPGMVKLLSKVGSALVEADYDGPGAGGDNSGFQGLTQQGAMQKMQSLREDEDFSRAYYDNSHPNHKSAVQQMEELGKIAYPGAVRPA